jgi:hypothetical protein
MIDDSRLGNFLYLLAEMEAAMELGGIEWTAATAANVRERLITVTAEVAIIANRHGRVPKVFTAWAEYTGPLDHRENSSRNGLPSL